MPATDRLRPHEHAAPPVTRKHPAERGQEHAISRTAVWPCHLPAEHREFVAQDEYLDLVRGVRPATEHSKLEEVPKQPVET
jgi:hypothetical protein